MQEKHTSGIDQHSLNRRDFLRLLFLTGGTAFLTACQKVLNIPSPTSSLFFSSTPKTTGTINYTPTSTNTVIPTQTLTSTKMPTQTDTPTRTSTITPTPTEMLVKKFIFQDDFERGLGKWSGIHRLGADVNIVDDPTNSEKGKVLKCTLNGNDIRPVRGYPDWYNGGWYTPKNIPGPCGIYVDVFATHDLSAGNPPWKILNNIFFKFRGSFEKDVAVLVAISDGDPLELKFRDITIKCRTPFNYGEWLNKCELRVEQGKLLAYRGGMLDINPDEAIEIPQELEEGTIGGHAGMYITYWHGEGILLPKGGSILNDNFRVVQYEYA